MNIAEMTERMNRLNTEISSILMDSGYVQENDFYPDEYHTKRKTITDEEGNSIETADLSADEWQLIREYERILSRLDDISEKLNYFAKPVAHEGKAYLTSNDRFAVDDCELRCGSRCEYQRYDKEHDCYYWVTDRVEHSDEKGGFYFFGSGEALSEGMNVRIR